MKSGLLTTEFWITLITGILGFTGTIHLPPIAYVVLAVGYAAARSLVKYGFLKGNVASVVSAIPAPPDPGK